MPADDQIAKQNIVPTTHAPLLLLLLLLLLFSAIDWLYSIRADSIPKSMKTVQATRLLNLCRTIP